MIYFSLSDIGNKNKKNQDSFFSQVKNYVNGEIGLFIVADGMGGHEKGEYASSKCVDIVKTTINEHISSINIDNIDDEYVKSIIYNSIKIANDIILESANNIIVGTTLVLALIINEKLFVANVGDSRTYMMNEDNFVQITKDNSYVQYLIDEGVLDKKQARTHEERHKITRAVGFEKDLEVDFYVREVQKKDKLILCSDGLTSMIEDEDIKTVLYEENPQYICKKLISLANQAGGDDNITVTSIII